jgi:hypothetical protein
MAKLSDPIILRCYLNALANWRFTNYVRFTRVAYEWLRSELEGFTAKAFAEMLFDFVNSGGEIDQVVEKRADWSMHDYHYDLRPVINGRRLYVETRLIYSDPADPDDPRILIVNIHDA